MTPTSADASTQPIAVICLIGVSGSGKTTVLNAVRERDPLIYQPVSCTTRDPRAGEKPGREYHFISEAEFAERVEAGDFAEHAPFNGKSYGTLWSEINKPGRIVVRVTENEGAKNLRNLVGAKIVAIQPPDDETWIARFVARGDDPKEVRERIAIDRARANEIAEIADFSIINEDLSTTVAELDAYIAHVVAEAAARSEQVKARARAFMEKNPAIFKALD